jgi:hypothetical protein
MLEITPIRDALGFVRQHPEMFFPGTAPNPLDCLRHLLVEVLALGASDASVRLIDGWWMLSSSFDWFLGKEPEQLFTRIVPLPEVGPNASHVEIVLTAFAQSVATFGTATGRFVVRGEPPDEEVWKEMVRSTRAVAFRF